MINDSQKEDFKLWKNINETKYLMSKARQKELNKYGLSMSTASVMDCLQASGEYATPTQIAEWTIRTPQSVSGILYRMEKSGYLIKTRDPKRKNVIRVSMTEKAAMVYKNVIKRKSIKRMLSCLSLEEREQLETMLKKMRALAIKEQKNNL